MSPDQDEIGRRIAIEREKLVNPDFDACTALIACDVPAAIRNLYADHDLITSRNIDFGGLTIRWFDPLVPPIHLHTDSDGRRYLSFACGDDGESYAVLIDPSESLSHVFVVWDDGLPDSINLTLESLLASRGG